MNKPNANTSARIFGCTPEQARNLMLKNAAGLRMMAEKAKRTGKNVNGYSLAYLEAKAAAYASA
jgi:hypothetical protein